MSDFSKAALDALVAQNLAQDTSRSAISAPAPEKRKGAPAWAQILNIAGPIADGLSTMHVMNQSGPMADGSGYVKGVEANPIYGKNPTAGKIMAVKGGQAALSALVSHFFPKIAKPLGVANGIVGGAAAGLNLHTANKIKKLRGID
jgi:hypothetical protein